MGKGVNVQDPSGVLQYIWVWKEADSRIESKNVLLKDPIYNPKPDGAIAGMVKTPDGMELRFARWKTSVKPARGTVLLLHGRSEFIERTYETVNDLRKMGLEVLTFDWRGQGGSTRILENPKRGYIDDFNEYTIDLETIMQEVALPDCKAPYFILAHSTGSLISLLSAPKLSNQIERMVLAAPFLGLGKQPISAPLVKILAGTLCMFGLGEVYMAGSSNPGISQKFEGNIHTSDPKRFERNKRLLKDFDELSIGGPTAAWVYAACRSMEEVSDVDFCKEISIPSLLISSGNDQVVSNKAIEMVAKRLRSGKCLTINGARHELLQERDIFREQLLAAFKSFTFKS